MIEKWKAVAITDAADAGYIMCGENTAVFSARKHHVFLLNGDTGRRRYHFADGTVMESGPREFHYLPKGCSFRLEQIMKGGYWSIQFSTAASLNCEPFNLPVQNYDALKGCFLEAIAAKELPIVQYGFVMRKCIYRILELLYEEAQPEPILTPKERLIQPAIEHINKIFYTNDKLHIPELARKCGISETYLRRLFRELHGKSPQTYLISKRMIYAKDLLRSGYTVRKTAIACGYSEPCHFSREFSRYVGISPKRYQLTSQAK